MATFVFTGDPNQGRRGVRDEKSDQSPGVKAFGYRFPRGEAVEVTDERAITKLRGNSHFEEIVADQGTGSGDDRAALVEEAKALGLKPGNKSADKLREEIAEAKATDQGTGSGD